MEIKLKITPYQYEKIGDGIAVNIIITMNQYSFQAYYWFHNDTDEIKIKCEDNFLKLFKVEKVEDIPFYDEFVKEIELSLPNKEKIKEEIL